MLLSYMVNLKERKYAPATISRKTAAIKSFFDFLLNERIVKEDPTENIASTKVGQSLPHVLSVSQMETLLSQPDDQSAPEGKRDKAMLEILYATGMRVTELI